MLPIFKDYRKMLLDNGLDLSEYDEDKLQKQIDKKLEEIEKLKAKIKITLDKK